MITSAAGIISFLDEPEDELKVWALERLNQIVGDFWPEISDSVEKIEVLYETEDFKHRELSALLASKLYYYLGSMRDAMDYALRAEDQFNIRDSTEYAVTIVNQCIDQYTKLKQEEYNAKALGEMLPEIDPRLEEIVNRVIEDLNPTQYKTAVGIAIQTRRLDVLERTIKEAVNSNEVVSYCTNMCARVIQHKGLREDILRLLVKLHSDLDHSQLNGISQPDYINICQCLIYLNNPSAVAEILIKLLNGNVDQLSLAYQIGFDLYDSAAQYFLSSVVDALKLGFPSEAQESDKSKQLKERVETLSSILDGAKSIELYLQFLIRNNHTDSLILKNTKDQVRNSICHNGCVIANGFMHAGTTIDQFLRDNLDWLSRAANWAKFTATSSLGVIHKGHENDSLSLMATYLPKSSTTGSPYQEGGGLYAIGLIHANHGRGKITEYLTQQLDAATNETVKHGGCLGLGLAAMGTTDKDVYQQLKNNLYQDDAVIGEAAGLAMGLVMIGSNNTEAIKDMISYAQETQHEKIIRGLAIGIALLAYGRMEEADSLIEQLIVDKDPILRRCGMYAIAMAYVGSGSNKANRKLLHFAVSDVNDDVRRAAVESLGFVMFRSPNQAPSVVSLLSESYNPHVRYGSAMALGIACAGTGNREALAILETLSADSVNYVRQGALIASSMVLIQHTDVSCPKVKTFRDLYKKVINDKHEDVMAKKGAILAQGIIDAGGRNVTLSLQSRTGHVNMSAVVGMLVFNQFWYWYPLAHFLSLTFTPSAIIGLNADLKMPKFEYRSNAKPSTFAYPVQLEEKKGKEQEKVETAVLSTTNKHKQKRGRRRASSAATSKTSNVESMEVDEKKKSEAMEVDSAEKEAEAKKPERNFEMVANPCRAIPPQLKVIKMPQDCRYTPLKSLSYGGIIILKNNNSSEPEELLEPVAAGGPKITKEDEGEEPQVPEDFVYDESKL